MYVKKVRRSQKSKELLNQDNFMTKEYLITCQEGALSPCNSLTLNSFPYDSDGLHCIYVEKLGPDKQSVICQNSWGDDLLYPHVKLSDIVDLFKVTFVASPKIPRTDEQDTGDDHTENDPNETIVLDSDSNTDIDDEGFSSNSEWDQSGIMIGTWTTRSGSKSIQSMSSLRITMRGVTRSLSSMATHKMEEEMGLRSFPLKTHRRRLSKYLGSGCQGEAPQKR